MKKGNPSAVVSLNGTQKTPFERNAKSGYKEFHGLKHKGTGRKLDDVEYCILLADYADALDKNNQNSPIPTDYGELDPTAIALAREVRRGHEAGLSKRELNKYIYQSIKE